MQINVNDHLFVYGSLRRGESADLSARQGAEFIQSDTINGSLYAVSWYPGARVQPGCYDTTLPHIVGDVFRIDDESLPPLLDAYEGYPTLFQRVETVTAGGIIVWVYTYNHPVDEDRLVPDGDWLNRPRMPIAGES